MKEIFFYFLQVIIISGILYGYYHFFLRDNKFHRYNRFYLLAATMISLGIPFLKIPLYFSSEEVDTSFLYRSIQIINGQEEVVISETSFSWQHLINWQSILITSYSLVFLLLFAKLLLSLNKVIRLRKQYPAAKVEDIHFINTTEPGTPFSFFNWLFWNRKIELKTEQGQQIFRHEWFHIQQKHSYDILLMEVVTVFLWINPFFHLLKKELKAIHEFLADDFAVQNYSKTEYAELLLMQALNTSNPLVNPFFHTQIKRRINMITTSQKPAFQYARKILVLPVLAIVITLFAFTYHQQPAIPALKDKMVVVIDAGHGGDDGGATSHSLNEKDINLSLAKEILALNKDANLEIVLSRDNDKEMLLSDRTKVAKEKRADLFISLHVDAAGLMANGKVNEEKNGFSVKVSRKNLQYDKENRALATVMLSQFEKIHATQQQILVPATGIWVLDHNNCPSILIECGYITNANDRSFITQKQNQQKVALAILAGIKKYAAEKENLLSVIQANDTVPSPLFLVDGKITNQASVNKINPDEIASVNVLKGKQAISQYGEKGKHGVIQITTKKNPTPLIITQNEKNKDQKKAHVVMNGKSESKISITDINKDEIASVKVLKDDAATKKYGKKGENGVIEITTKDKEAKTNPLFVVNGEEQPEITTSNLSEKIKPEDIESINVLKEKSALSKYGEKGKNGVIEITSKKK